MYILLFSKTIRSNHIALSIHEKFHGAQTIKKNKITFLKFDNEKTVHLDDVALLFGVVASKDS